MAAAKKAAAKTAPRKAASKPAAKPAATPTPATSAWTASPEPAPMAAPATPTPAPAAPAASAMDERTYTMLLHLSALTWLLSIPGFIGPLVMWLVKKDQSPFIDRHGRAALDFQISLFIYMAAAGLLFAVITVLTLGIGALLLLPLVIIAALAAVVLVIVFPILASLKANQGLEYAYPLSLRILRRQQ